MVEALRIALQGHRMIEKIGHIKNPLTIIAIFAGIAEISGTVVLPFIQERNQTYLLWFHILFPALLLVIFFAMLRFKPKALYAPSDYSNEENSIDANICIPPNQIQLRQMVDMLRKYLVDHPETRQLDMSTS